MNNPINGSYSIQQVSDITGISKQVIRKWEERYQVVQPKRLGNGYRIYSDKDINMLLAVKSLSDQGHSIKQAALVAKASEPSIENIYNHKMEHEALNDFVLRLLHQGASCHEREMNQTLQQAYHHLGLEMFISSVVIPFLKEVGNHWEKKQWSEYQEALSSLVVRDFLIQIRRNFQHVDNAPLLMGACLPNEQHEVPLHILLLQGMLKGWKTVLIGASPAPGSIESMVEKLGPKKVLLSATTTIPFDKDPILLKKLDELAGKHKQINFYLGGAGVINYLSNIKLKNIQVTSSIDDVFFG